MTIKRHRVSYTELVIDPATSEAYLEFSTAAGDLRIPVELPGAAEVNAAWGLCEAYLVLKFGTAAAHTYMQSKRTDFWQQFIFLGDPPNTLNRGELHADAYSWLEAYNA